MYTGDAFLVHICCKLADAVACETVLIIVDHDGTNVDVPAATIPLLSDNQVEIITRGSKAQLAAWYTYTALICKLLDIYVLL
jgi:hypothetical protein